MTEKQSPELLGKYTNGNYTVEIFSDGTKVRKTLDDTATEWLPAFPETIYVNLSDKCSASCKYCDQDCQPDGKEADLQKASRLLISAAPYSEIWLSVNSSDCKLLESVLKQMKEHNIIVNLTINQNHLHNNLETILQFQKENLIHKVNISFCKFTRELMQDYHKLKNATIVLICGIVSLAEVVRLSEFYPKILFRGFKTSGRGRVFAKVHNHKIHKNIEALKKNLQTLSEHFSVMSFDDLTLQQLDVKNLKEYKNMSQGDNDMFTMYLDCVIMKYKKTQTSMEYDVEGTIHDMFRSLNKPNEDLL